MFQGSFVAIVTPFKDGVIDKKTFFDLIDFQIENGTDGIVPCGTTGESATLTEEEHIEVIKLTVERVNGRVPIIAGTGSNSTDSTIELTKEAQSIGVDAALIITPYYNKPTPKGMIEHFTAVADSIDIPIVLYNVPGRTGINLKPATAIELSKHKNIVAIKEASGSLDAVTEIIVGSDLTVLSGDDSLTMPMMAIGSKGVVSVAANAVPDKVHAMTEAMLKKDYDTAKDLYYKLYPMFTNIFAETNPIPIKECLYLMGKIDREYRLPMTTCLPETTELLKKTLLDLGIEVVL